MTHIQNALATLLLMVLAAVIIGLAFRAADIEAQNHEIYLCDNYDICGGTQ